VTGPLSGLRIVELAGIGPGPFCGMLLADFGADVIRVERPDAEFDLGNVATRGRRSIAVDLKTPEGAAVVRRLLEDADGLIEGFRPGVTERLGLGPDECLALNPRLVYGRMTGWGQTGPLAATAGHDIDYIAIAGVLHPMGDPDRPPMPPLNLVGDYGGGAMFLAFGMVSAMLHARTTGEGQVVDAAMTEGAAVLAALCYGGLASGIWHNERGVNILDGSAPFYGVYACSDGEFFAIGAAEPHFSDQLLRLLGLRDEDGIWEAWYQREEWPRLRRRVAEVMATRTRAQWTEIFDGTDACAVPVLSMQEAQQHPHNVARQTFVDVGGVVQPAPAPRLSRTPGEVTRAPVHPGADTVEVLRRCGYSPDEIDGLIESGAVGAARVPDPGGAAVHP